MIKIDKKILAGSLAAIGLGILLSPLTNVWKSDKDRAGVMAEEESKKAYILSSLEDAYQNGKSIANVLKKTVVVQKDNLTTGNCKGTLIDFDKDGFFDEKFLGKKIPSGSDKDIILHYNFCSMLWSSTPTVSFMFSRKDLNTDKFTEIVKGGIYIPAAIAKTNDISSESPEFHVEYGYVPRNALIN